MSLLVAGVTCSRAAAALPQGFVSAQQKETARTLMLTGDEKMAAADYRGALDAYQSAEQIVRVPTTSYAVGRAYAQLNLWVEAVDALQRVARYPVETAEPKAFRTARAGAAKLDADLARRIPTISVAVSGPAPETPIRVAVDGGTLEGGSARAPRRVNPGEHVLAVTAPGYLDQSRRVSVAEGEHPRLAFTLLRDPNAPAVEPGDALVQQPVARADEPAWLSPLMWSGFSVGAAGVAIGAITGGLVLARRDDLESRCGGLNCPASERAAYGEINSLAWVSNIAFGVGVAGVAVGAGALIAAQFNDEPEPANVSWQPLIGPGLVGVQGSF